MTISDLFLMFNLKLTVAANESVIVKYTSHT